LPPELGVPLKFLPAAAGGAAEKKLPAALDLFCGVMFNY
jgi:hypothetical protein